MTPEKRQRIRKAIARLDQFSLDNNLIKKHSIRSPVTFGEEKSNVKFSDVPFAFSRLLPDSNVRPVEELNDFKPPLNIGMYNASANPKE